MPPTIRLLIFFVLGEKAFEVDDSQNENTLAETKNGNAKIKTKDMNYTACNEATHKPVSINNEATQDADFFTGATPSPHWRRCRCFRCHRRRLIGGGGLLKSDDNNEDFKEEEYFNIDRYY